MARRRPRRRRRPRGAPSARAAPATICRASRSTSADLARGIQAIDLLHRAGLAASKSEARRLIKGGGARVNGEAIADDAAVLTSADVTREGYIKLSAGKKKHALVRPR